MSQSTLCFGIDFGTTFSGVSWAWSGRPNEEPHPVTKWPRNSKTGLNADREQTPTQFDFKSGQHKDETIEWGYKVPPKADPFRWFKLLLADSDQLPAYLKASDELEKVRKRLEKEGLDPVEAVAKYLRQLWIHTLDEVTSALGRHTVEESFFQIVLTIPAIWRDTAREKMRNAAGKAGLLDSRPIGPTALTLISEPEAGALATLRSMEGRPDITPGDCILIVDAGGGTVDLISYTVDSLSPFTLSECVEGTGGLCGAVFLDRSFQEFVRTKIGPTAWDAMKPFQARKFMETEWEVGPKAMFDGKDLEPVILDLPRPCEILLGDAELVLEHGDIVKIFDPIVKEIEALVLQQVRAVKKKCGKPPKHVVLIGGFGRSSYLAARLRQLRVDDHRDTSVLQAGGSGPWMAICRGAVVSALSKGGWINLSVQVVSRISRASYGTRISAVFQESVHHEDDKYWDDKDGFYRARDQMEWYMARGDSISTLNPKIYRYNMTFSPDSRKPLEHIRVIFTIDISYEEKAPTRWAASSSIKELCKIEFFWPVAFQDLPIETNEKTHTQSRRIRYQVKVTADGSSANFELYEDSQQGLSLETAKVLATRRIEIDFNTDLEKQLGGLSLEG